MKNTKERVKVKGVIYDSSVPKDVRKFIFLMTRQSSPNKEKVLGAITMTGITFNKMRKGGNSSYFNNNYRHNFEARFYMRRLWRREGFTFLLTDKKTSHEYILNTEDVFMIINPKSYKNRENYKEYNIDDFILEEENESNGYFSNYKLKHENDEIPYVIFSEDKKETEVADIKNDAQRRYNTIMGKNISEETNVHVLKNSDFIESDDIDDFLNGIDSLMDKVKSKIEYHNKRIEHHQTEINKIKNSLNKYNNLASLI